MENIPSIVSQVCSGLTQAGGLIPQPVECALLAVGAFKAAEHVWSFIGGTWQHLLRPRRQLKSRYGRPGMEPWVLITGGASGIGKGYALELAAEGFSIYIVDKNKGDCISAQREIKQLGVACDFMVYDFGVLGNAQEAEKFSADLKSGLQGKDLAVVINNVAEFQHEEFAKVSYDTLFRATNVNCHAQGVVCNTFLTQLMARPTRSAIISVGTNAAEPQNPRYKFALYGATKSYNHILSSGLEECYGDKIDIMTVIPRQTKTKMNPADYMFTATTQEHAKAVVDKIGWDSRTYGTLTHHLEYNMRFVYVPFGIFDKFVQWCNKSRSEKMIKMYESANKMM